ncbi:alpha/beta hydrolase [Rhodopirellula sp. JC740]|uniref:Alpha/beta hydrolase n=1 Tax=Rhodopirellula halodulae TaxID=2894198 RepID=A0ABS8NI65_9BACT|nr:alpha/beta hydrolase [Rhodopirellula sp. JC740]MCC9643221.1 alpha/beta hydrolase [Rhodopirellula sp. JC740]
MVSNLEPSSSELTHFETLDGRELHCQVDGPAAADLCWVVVHGLGEHVGCYPDFVQRMTDKGRGVVLYDQHGHGESPGARGDAPSFETLVDDITVALDFAAQQFPSAELVLLGHSMGGNLVLNQLLGRENQHVRRAVVTNPMILPPNPPTRPQAFAAWLTGKLIPHIRVSASIDPTQLTQDEDALRQIATDELVHESLSIGIGSQLLNHGIWLLDHASKLEHDLLVLTGSEDELCDSQTTVDFVRQAGSHCQHVPLVGMRHSLLIEADRDRAYRAIEAWLDATSSE